MQGKLQGAVNGPVLFSISLRIVTNLDPAPGTFLHELKLET